MTATTYHRIVAIRRQIGRNPTRATVKPFIEELAELYNAGELNTRDLIRYFGDGARALIWRHADQLESDRMRKEFKEHGRLL